MDDSILSEPLISCGGGGQQCWISPFSVCSHPLEQQQKRNFQFIDFHLRTVTVIARNLIKVRSFLSKSLLLHYQNSSFLLLFCPFWIALGPKIRISEEVVWFWGGREGWWVCTVSVRCFTSLSLPLAHSLAGCAVAVAVPLFPSAGCLQWRSNKNRIQLSPSSFLIAISPSFFPFFFIRKNRIGFNLSSYWTTSIIHSFLPSLLTLVVVVLVVSQCRKLWTIQSTLKTST